MTLINLVALIFIMVGLALGWLAFSRATFQPADDNMQVRLFGVYSPLLTWLRYRRMPVMKQQVQVSLLEWLRAHAGTVVELGIIAGWAMWVGRAYLDFDPFMWPVSSEIGGQLNTHYIWVQLQRCGLCALWDGTINGGMPALADAFGSKLHPLVMITTLLWGVMAGAKVALVICFIIAGYAQWWIARLLKLGRVARVWSAMLIVVGGHLSARMATGQFGIVLSTASCSLALAAAIDLALTGKRRSTLALAVTGALAIVSGQGYLQLSLLSWAPAFLFLLLDDEFHLRPVWKEYALAVGLSVLMAGLFLIPAVHFLPNFAKETDPLFTRAQPLEYAPLNLVIRDLAFMNTNVLGKFVAPELFTIYIGWVPVLLAIISIRFIRRDNARLALCLIAGMMMSFLMGSAIPLKWLAKLSTYFDGFRHPSLMSILAVPPIVALAAYGFDQLLKLNWPKLTISFTTAKSATLSVAWVLAVPLYWSFSTAYDLSQVFIRTSDASPIYQSYQQVISDLYLTGDRWIALPFGEHFWIEPAVAAQLKVTNVVWAWKWKNREPPKPYLIANRTGAPPDTEVVGLLGDIPIYQDAQAEYAYIASGAQKVPCQAAGSGGDLTVTCSTDRAGQLVVEENSWVGWYVWRDEKPEPLKQDRWLAVTAPAGQHTYEFRYRPWDVAVGLAATLIGCGLTLWLWRRASSTEPQ
ncbi:MAG: hypothetical protein HYZ49_09300 [Chloroflexi bacterium]|nr:hypothetical protein [Chloroflexota bacterium]